MDADRLIVVDAVKGGAAPGSIYRFDIEDAPSSPEEYKTSVHQISILEVVHLSELVGETPMTTIIGVEPKSIDMGMELSPELEAKLPKIIDLVFEEIKRPWPPSHHK
jgi:hydrogenase maturation protease